MCIRDRTDFDPWGWGTATALVVSEAGDARTYWPQCRALMLKAVTHNGLILYAPTEPSRQAA